MKKNLFLFSILIALTTFVYFFEELGGIKHSNENKKKRQIFNHHSLGKLETFKTPSVTLSNKGKYFVTSKKNFRVDPLKVQKIFGILGGIEIERDLLTEGVSGKELPERKNFFPDETLKFKFKFEKGELEYLLGNKIEVSRSFYVEISKKDANGKLEKKWVVAKDSSLDEGVYSKKDFYISPRRYNRIKSIIYLDEEFYYDRNVFNDSKVQFSKIQVENKRNKKFELDIKNNKTSPQVYNGLNMNETFIKEFVKNMGNLKGDSLVLSFNPDQLTEKVSTVSFESKDKNINTLSLFIKYKGKIGYYLNKKGESWLYKLNKKSSTPFFSNVQDFWDMRILNPKSSFGRTPEGSEVQLVFSDSKKYLFNLKAVKKLDVKSLDLNRKVNLISFQKLVGFLKERALRVSTLNNFDLLKKSKFRFSFGMGLMNFLIKDNEILLLNEDLKYILHYPFKGDLPFGVLEKDYFEE